MTILPAAARKIVTAHGAAASAVPARADSDDMMKVIAGIAAIAIIGSALNDNDRHRPPRPVVRPQPPRPHPGWHQPVQPPHPGWHHPTPPRPPVVYHPRQPRPLPCAPYGCVNPDAGFRDRPMPVEPHRGWHGRAPHHPSR